jgi:hypothetical protein
VEIGKRIIYKLVLNQFFCNIGIFPDQCSIFPITKMNLIKYSLKHISTLEFSSPLKVMSEVVGK